MATEMCITLQNMDVELIKQALGKPGKSKKGLAAAIGKQPSAVTAILRGERRVQANELRLIAKYLELKITDGEELLTPVPIMPIITSSPQATDGPSALETIQATVNKVAELEQRVVALEDLMRAIGGLQPKKR